MKFVLLVGASLFAAFPALAQGTPPRQLGAAPLVVREPNSTGNDREVVTSRGATGADTVTSDSAAGGNAERPEQRIPNSSAR